MNKWAFVIWNDARYLRPDTRFGKMLKQKF